MKYIYTNTANKTTYECNAEDIIAADKLYEKFNVDSHYLFGTATAKKIPSCITTWSPDWSSNGIRRLVI